MYDYHQINTCSLLEEACESLKLLFRSRRYSSRRKFTIGDRVYIDDGGGQFHSTNEEDVANGICEIEDLGTAPWKLNPQTRK
jgi:hypothetical protein